MGIAQKSAFNLRMYESPLMSFVFSQAFQQLQIYIQFTLSLQRIG